MWNTALTIAPQPLPWSRNDDRSDDTQDKRLVDQGPIKEKLKALVAGEPIYDPKGLD